MTRCTGHCCESFPLPFSPTAAPDVLANAQDGAFILDMLVPLHPSTSDPFHIYTCRHFDVATRNCGVYDERPRMCSEYPYGLPCNVKGCTRDSAEPDPIPPGALLRNVERSS